MTTVQRNAENNAKSERLSWQDTFNVMPVGYTVRKIRECFPAAVGRRPLPKQALDTVREKEENE